MQGNIATRRPPWMRCRCDSASINSVFQRKPGVSALRILIMPAYNSVYAECILLKWIRNHALHK